MTESTAEYRVDAECCIIDNWPWAPAPMPTYGPDYHTTWSPPRVIGRCSLCGGDVVEPRYWSNDTRPHCVSCGAVKKRNLPVIEMEKPTRPKYSTTTTFEGTLNAQGPKQSGSLWSDDAAEGREDRRSNERARKET